MEPLFLPDEEEENTIFPNVLPPEDIDVAALFEGIEELQEEVVIEGEETIRQRADQKARETFEKTRHKRLPKVTPHQMLPSSSPTRDIDDGPVGGGGQKTGTKDKTDKDGGKKERRKPMRLDEARLLGPTGFPQLINDTKNFRVKGKGHEATDLNRLLQVYQFWAHRMYPKSQFNDTVERVEKLCRSRRMNVKLSVWRDEARGKKVQVSDEEPEDQVIDLTENEGGADSERAQYASSSPVPITRPPSSPDTSGRSSIAEDEEFEAAFREMEQRQEEDLAASRSQPGVPPSNFSRNDRMDVDEEDMWSGFDEMPDVGVTTSSSATDSSALLTSRSASRSIDDYEDEDMWDVVKEYEQTKGGEAALSSAEVTSKPTEKAQLPPEGGSTSTTTSRRKSTVEEDWEDMYM
ncbi:Swi3-domain-containing protein [Marasmius fiardii PR-910]|nr:Swi3-domain-containing protein [Marasmius fiardii PR-910]